VEVDLRHFLNSGYTSNSLLSAAENYNFAFLLCLFVCLVCQQKNSKNHSWNLWKGRYWG